jgi:hypothetical protein
MRYLVLFAFLFLVFACTNTVKSPSPKDTTANAAVQEAYPNKDTTRAVTKQQVKAAADDDPEPSLAEIMHETISSYDHTVIIDTVFKVEGATYRFHLKHYCLRDSAVHLPKRYVNDFKLDSFVTHSFATDLTLDKNGKEILRQTILKKDFEKLLDPSLKAYATLREPNFKLWGDSIILGYSISIPLTDVGQGFDAVIDSAGHVAYEPFTAHTMY